MVLLNKWTLVALGALSLAGGAYAENKLQKAVQDIKTGAFDITDKQSAVVDFEKGSATVSDGERSDLKALVDAVKSDAQIDKVVVAAWSDNEMPKDKNTKLSDADRKLAEERGKNVEAALKSLGAPNVESHAMAEYPSWIARTFNTDDAKVKGEGQTKNTEDAVITEVGREIREAGGPGKVVVFVLNKGDSLSH